MKIVVAILTDIHLTEIPSHPLSKRIDLIADAIGAAEATPDGIVVVLGGDIADKGLEAEYAAMTALLTRLKKQLADRFPTIELQIVSVPGNHDLLHPTDSESYRAKLVEGAIPTLGEIRPNSVWIAQLLEPQAAYHKFATSLDLPLISENSRICETVTLTFGSQKLRLNLVNTALTSQINEKQGSIRLPMAVLRNALEADADPALTLTVMHHPLYWIESNTLTDLREVLSRTSDYVLTGHQHFASGLEETFDLGANIKYYESPALCDPKSPNSSAFRVLVFDLNGEAEKQLIFKWKDGRYIRDPRRDTESDWTALVKNRALRPGFAMNRSTIEVLNHPGFAYISRPGINIGLNDLFVYPDFRPTQKHLARDSKVIKGRDALGYLINNGVTIVQGSPLSGKTTISKKVMLDVRANNELVPVWLNGAGLTITTTDQLEVAIYSEFKSQYSQQQLDSYEQLLPSRRAIMIDDWHLARIAPEMRRDVYQWLNRFCGTALLFTDNVFKVNEAVASLTNGAAVVNGEPREVQIGTLSNVSKASLISRWLKSRSEAPTGDLDESREFKRIEDLVATLLGKGSLPPYAFFVLCILQALESKKTAALAGGSFGPLFEILLLSSLERAESDDLDLSVKLVFMQEIAYAMWTRRVSALSRREIDEVATAFSQRSLMSIPVEKYLVHLKEAKVIEAYDGNYAFTYPHYRYYSIARYIRDHIDDTESNNLHDCVDEMIDRISSVENSTIVLFLIYFEKDKHRIIDRLVRNAKEVYGVVPAATLDNDVEMFSSARPMIAAPMIEENPNISQNRHKRRLKKDEQEQASAKSSESGEVATSRDGYKYSEALSDTQKLHLVNQNMGALGQVIRNFSANLEGPRKVEVLRETYLLGLRAIARVMQVLGGCIGKVESLEYSGSGPLSLATLKAKISQALVTLAQLYVVVVCEKISFNVGVVNLEKAYTTALERLDQSVAIRLIGVTVQLYHFSTFPSSEISALYQDIRTNKFALDILQWLVASYLALHRVDPRTQGEMIKLFNFNKTTLADPKRP